MYCIISMHDQEIFLGYRIYMFMVNYRLTSDGIVLSWNGKDMLLDGEDAEYVNELIDVIREN